jgi:hypothetical protein
MKGNDYTTGDILSRGCAEMEEEGKQEGGERAERELRARTLQVTDRWMIRDIEGWLIERPELIEPVVRYMRMEIESEGDKAKELRYLLQFCEGIPQGESLREWREAVRAKIEKVFDLMEEFGEESKEEAGVYELERV